MFDNRLNLRSDKWIPELKTLCLNFLNKVKTSPGGHFLQFSDELGTEERPGRIVEA